MDGRAQRKITLALTGALIGFCFALVAMVHHSGRQIVARWVALMVICLWRAVHLHRESREPRRPARRWGEGSSAGGDALRHLQ